MPRPSEGQPPSTKAGRRSRGRSRPSTGPLLHLSCLLGSPVRGPDGHQAGKLTDVIARLAAGDHPEVSGLVVSANGRERFVHAHDVAGLSNDGADLAVAPAELGFFERRPGEVLLARDVRSRHLIHVERARLVRANEIELANVEGTWRVFGVDPTSKALLRKLLPHRLRRRVRPGRVVDWADLEPFVAHVPAARLQIRFRRLRRMHPAKLADLVEAASHDEGEEIMRAVGADAELEADVFEELDVDHQVEFLKERSDEEAAKLLAKMAPDDAVDLLTELDQERRVPILQQLPQATQSKLRGLLSYNPETAGGLMNPDFVSVAATSTVADALSSVKASSAPPEAAGVVFLTDAQGSLAGTALVVDLLRAKPDARVTSVARPEPATLSPDSDIHEVVRTMTDYNLAVAPVVDEEGRMLGQITVDDVLELLLPQGWRRQYGMTAPD
ncbi:MAG: magnesium transporter MgtE N-terminal domain-containing protein [Acidimicrobiales bacterium]